MVNIIPITKVNEKRMIDVANAIPTNTHVVRLLDIISSKTLKLNSTFYKIKNSGGIHKFLNTEKEVILSLIVKDDMLAKLTPDDYVFIINAIKPDFYTTPDCETYLGEDTVSISEIKKVLIATKHLLLSCPLSKPIGHIKGSNGWMAERHLFFLKFLGIDDFIFHVGDFFRYGRPNMIIKARNIAFKLRKHSRKLYLYGMGSQSNLLSFSFADAYITNTHFVTAINGKRFTGTKKRKYNTKNYMKIVKENLLQIYANVKRTREQKKLIGGGNPWEEDQEEHVIPTHQKQKQ